MVIPDWSALRAPRPKELELIAPSPSAARPRERLAAAIIDHGIILLPLYLLLSAPFKRHMTEGALLGADGEVYLASFSMVVIAIALSLAYQTLTIYFLGATFGQRLFGLRVRSVFADAPLNFWACLVRSFGWLLTLALGGLPALAIFSDRRRRALHDRLCDGMVTALAPTGIAPPSAFSRRLVQTSYVAMALILCLSIASRVEMALDAIDGERVFAGTGGGGDECEAVANAVPEHGAPEHARVTAALTLFSAGLAERACLRHELDLEAAEHVKPAPITYLAQAFANADDADLSNDYLDEACKVAKDGPECAMSQLVAEWSDDHWPAIEGLLKKAPTGSGYIEVWAVRHFMTQAKPSEALAWLDRLGEHREVGEFVMSERVRALYDAHFANEAKVALSQAIAGLPDDTALELRGWTCAQELQKGCGALEHLACAPYAKSNEANTMDVPSVALAKLMSKECRGAVDYAALEEDAKDQNFVTFLRANAKASVHDNDEAISLFASLVDGDDTPDLLRVEAGRRLLQSGTAAQVRQLRQAWRGLASREAWVKLGNLLVNHHVQHGDRDLAREIASQLAQDLSPQAVTALATLDQGESPRRPASEDKE